MIRFSVDYSDLLLNALSGADLSSIKRAFIAAYSSASSTLLDSPFPSGLYALDVAECMLFIGNLVRDSLVSEAYVLLDSPTITETRTASSLISRERGLRTSAVASWPADSLEASIAGGLPWWTAAGQVISAHYAPSSVGVGMAVWGGRLSRFVLLGMNAVDTLIFYGDAGEGRFREVVGRLECPPANMRITYKRMPHPR